MKMKKILILGLMLLNVCSFGQKMSGRIIFETSRDLGKTLAKAKFMSKEEKDRESETWKNQFSQKTKMVLSFAPNSSFYTFENQQETTEDGTYTYTHDDFYITRDFEKQTYLDYQNILGKNYVVEDSLKPLKWKIMNDLKEVSGYICMKAIAFDSLKSQKVEAWFCTDLAVPAGPDRFFGLPGVILELILDDGAFAITSTVVDVSGTTEYPRLPKKLKGKKINTLGYNKLISDYISQSEAMHRLPWWLY